MPKKKGKGNPSSDVSALNEMESSIKKKEILALLDIEFEDELNTDSLKNLNEINTNQLINEK